ncbi:hypothetical protein DY023_10395 [Microbacterium bovistercoris]|uniref:Uncharacterized protein n=1 Tax=Microbacterium bovistercoris TaxID=2293570 RepID=A0A371NSP0_9MICO|nr:hypothetical protein [Microbacterium bovistercoris]REJ05258.1 hypothetical protein DY023_10395 [Microbacterium bovistercoris]
MAGRATRAAVAMALVLMLGGTAASPALAAGKPHEKQLDPVRDALAVYADFDGAARLSDYPAGPVPKLSGETCIIDPEGMGAMGEHYVEPGDVGDGMIDALHPEALIYEPQDDGSRELVGVEYLVFQEAWNTEHNQVPMLFGQKFMAFDETNPYGLPPFYALHAWLWRANPHGVFAMHNPAVTCPQE